MRVEQPTARVDKPVKLSASCAHQTKITELVVISLRKRRKLTEMKRTLFCLEREGQR